MKTKTLITLLSLILLSSFVWAGLNDDLFKAVEDGDKKKVAALIKKGADVNAKNEDGEIPLSYAINMYSNDMAKLLIKKGADINAKGLGGTPLRNAISTGNVEIAKLLIEKGADINSKASGYGTPLHTAAEHGIIEIAPLLIKKGADVNAKVNDDDDGSGRTPLHYAAEGRYSPSPDGGYFVLEEGHLAIAKLLIQKGADVNAKDRDGQTPLDLASSKKMKELLKKAGGKKLK